MRFCVHQGIWALIVFTGAYGRQVPLRPEKDANSFLDGIQVTESWDFDTPPAQNSTSNLLFDTVNSLLQHWPNTRYRNGHNIVLGMVPVGMPLYHGAHAPEVPTEPEWLATDPEHSYLFCRGSLDTGCWHFTFVATRPLKVLYFDGTSAAKMRGGPMDSQDILAWGSIKPDWTFSERERINALCVWGKEFELDGFVRMEMDFEIMLCDFSKGLKAISTLNLATAVIRPWYPPSESPDNTTAHIFDDDSRLMTSVIQAGSWHNHYPGDPRIQLDLTRLVSFYDTSLVPSLVPPRHGQQRHEHRLEGISIDDVQAVKKAIAGVLTSEAIGSGVDWKGLFRVVTLRYADRLELIRHLLNSTEAEQIPRDPFERAKLVQQQLRIMLTPYILNSAVPPPKATNKNWAAPVFKLCASSHTQFIETLSSRLTNSEVVLLDTVRNTNHEICRVIVNMWAESVLAGLDSRLPQATRIKVESEPEELNKLLDRWHTEINGLIAWLDWGIWIKCRPACGFEEMCYLPTWPFFRAPRGEPPGPGLGPQRPPENRPAPPGKTPDREKDWLIPQPRCIRRVEPYGLL